MKKIGYFLLLILFPAFSFALDYQDLYPYLIQPEGWSCEKPTGSKMSAVYGEVLTAERICRSGKKEIDVSVMKGPMAMSMFAPFTMVKEVDTPEEYVKVFKVNGFNGGVSHNKKENSGNLIIQLTADTVFSMQYNNLSYKEAIELSKKFPLKEIAKKILGL